MYKIEIGNKIGEKRKLECDGTSNIYALFRELNITDYPYRLKIGQNKNGVSVRFVSDNDFDAAIAKILTNNRDTLNDSLIVSRLLNDIKDESMQEEIERNALNGQYETKEDLYADIREMKIEFAAAHEDFYCPLQATIIDENGNEWNIAQEDLPVYENETQLKIEDCQEADMDMAAYVGKHANLRDKLLYVEWGVENRNDRLYGKISCYFSTPLSTEETERLKDAITGQNSDGFGEGFEQCGIKTEDGEIHVSLWNHEEYFLKSGVEMDEYLQKNEIKMGGI
ncbi:MAG: hypothetical protein SOX77_05030 [Candidatus Borkfalkiaceae bacterium]|nr:hypothetical protein [Christensenellaceae bacterium]